MPSHSYAQNERLRNTHEIFVTLTEFPNTFCNALNYLMKRHEITNEELAELIGVSPRTISTYRNDVRNPTREIVYAICFALHLAPEVSQEFIRTAGISPRVDEQDIYIRILLRDNYACSAFEINELLIHDGFIPLTNSWRETA